MKTTQKKFTIVGSCTSRNVNIIKQPLSLLIFLVIDTRGFCGAQVSIYYIAKIMYVLYHYLSKLFLICLFILPLVFRHYDNNKCRIYSSSCIDRKVFVEILYFKLCTCYLSLTSLSYINALFSQYFNWRLAVTASSSSHRTK